MSLAILVVDDEPDVEALYRQQFRRELRQGVFALLFALSAAEALQKVERIAAEELVLVLSDINMPGMSGLDLLARIKIDRPDLPVVMITAYGDSDTRREADQRGAAAFLTKPVDFTMLRAEITTRIAARGGTA